MPRLILAVAVIATAVVLDAGHADEFPVGEPEMPPYVVKTLPIRDSGDPPEVQFIDTTVGLIGEPNSKSFGVSFRGTLAPRVEMSGKEKLVAYLYMDCDAGSPTKDISVGMVEMATMKRGREKSNVLARADATAFVPLENVACARMGVENYEPEESPYVVKTFPIPDLGDLPGIELTDATVSLIGEPASKSFGLSYRGTLTPEVEMTGSEKLVVYLYIDCDDKIPSKTSGTNVGTVNIDTLKEGRRISTLIATADATAFVPLSYVECAKIGIQ